MALRAIRLLLLVVLVALGGVASAGEPQHVRVSWDQADTAHTAAVTWNTVSVQDPSIIEYGLTAAYGLQATGTAFQGNGALGAIHSVTIDELEPDTVYHYRVGGPGSWSIDYTFRTGVTDGCSPFRFVALGDNRGDTSFAPSSLWNPILTEALAHGPSFILNTGDLVKDGDEDEQWKAFLETTGDGVASVPLMPSLGNHDDDKVAGDGASYNQLFTLPRNPQTNSEDYYYFIYGDALFAAISTATFKDGTDIEQQAAWLDQVLTDNPTTWKFVYFHHPIYTGSVDLFGLVDIGHPPNELNQNQHLVPVFDKHHVDIVFNGHNHFYQRFEPMCCGGGGDDGVPTGDAATGTVYIITGGAGAITYDVPGIDLLLGTADGSVAVSGKHHYVLMEVDGNSATGRVYTTAPQLTGSDPDNIELIDEFTIFKEGPPPDCDEPTSPPPESGADAGGTEADAGSPTDPPDAGSSPANPQEEVIETGPEISPPATGLDTVDPGPSPEPPGSPPPGLPGETPGQGSVESGGGSSSDGGCATGGGTPLWAGPLMVAIVALVIARRRTIRLS
ncbi:MAG: metallophosphoesterase family protein [Myxococcota bacterium]|nr:metallophosphoesterase family protein [Myxococcota bacterium]MEE2779697.1 metallophosphoesterase family protein [Myxococcota bacterium]